MPPTLRRCCSELSVGARGRLSRVVAVAACILLGASAACTNAPPPASRAPTPPRGQLPIRSTVDASPPPDAACPTDIAGFLRRHAAMYGDADQVDRELPVSFRGAVHGAVDMPSEIVLDGARSRVSVWRGNHLVDASGIDERGAWATSLGGVPIRFDAADEVWGSRLEAWMLRRSYLREPPLGIECESADEVTRGFAYVRYGVAAPARVDVAFDIATAELRGVFLTSAAGHRLSQQDVSNWRPADANGVRWPMQRGSGAALMQLDAPVAGWHCRAGATAEACLTAIQTTEIAWPPSRRVALPMSTKGNEILVRAKIGGQLRTVVIDSAASVSGGIVEAAIAPSFTADAPATSFAGSDGVFEERLGSIDRIDFGSLVVQHAPALMHPMDTWRPTDPDRPVAVVGATLFDAAVVRFDFARQEIVLVPAADGATLRGPLAIDLPITRKNDQLYARINVDGTAGDFEVDTGSAFGVSYSPRWATMHPVGEGHRALGSTRGAYGGPRPVARAAEIDLGPISVSDSLVILETTEPGYGAGLVGNVILARCQAAIFDVAHARLSVEPPCTRDVPEDHLGASLLWPAGGGAPKVDTVVVDSPAEHAGLAHGDEVLSIDGRPPSTLPWFGWWAAGARPAGTKLTLRLRRAGAVVTVKVSLGPVGGAATPP